MEKKSKKVFVAFLDILGFKTYVLKNDMDKVKHMVTNLFSLAAMIGTAYVSTTRHNQSGENIKKLGPSKKIKKSDGTDAFIPNLDVSNINSVLMFDSIVLWTDGDNETDIIDLVNVVRFMLQSQLIIGLPLRGAISYGEFHFSDLKVPSKSIIKHSILVSPAQIFAMTLESKQEWSGCILDPYTVEKCKELNINLDTNDLISVVYYPVPLKEAVKNYYALIWQGQVYEYVGGKHPVDMNEYVRKAFLQNGEPINNSIENKIKNTVEFVNFSINHPVTIKPC